MVRNSDRSLDAAIPDQRILRYVLLIGLLSGALYIAVYLAQRAFFHNGLVLVDVNPVPPTTPLDRRELRWQAGLYYGATVILFGLYGWLLYLCRHGHLNTAKVRTYALLFPVLFNVGLLFGRPYLSLDLFSYSAYGYLGASLGQNPYIGQTADVLHTPFGANLALWGWRVLGSPPYGPLWIHVLIAIGHTSRHLRLVLLLTKLVVVGASLGSAWLIYLILGRVRPQDQLLGTLLYLWNPMLIVEFAVEGHVDALMIFFLLLALWFAVRGQLAPAIIALTFGIITKYLPVIFGPPLLAYHWHTRRSWRHFVQQVALGTTVGLVLTVFAYWPFWAGVATFNGILGQASLSGVLSLSGALYGYLLHWRPQPQAAQWTSLSLRAIFSIYVLIVSFFARKPESLLQVCGSIALICLAIAIPIYWPWYATMAVALLALTPNGAFGWTALALSFGSRLSSPILLIELNGFQEWGQQLYWAQLLWAIVLPCLLFVILWWRRKPRTSFASNQTMSNSEG